MFPRMLQRLSMIHRRLQQDGEAPLPSYSEEVWWQMGMGGQRTNGIRWTQNEIHNITSTGPLQTRSTKEARDRHVEIPLFRNHISTIRQWEMETSSLPIEDDDGRRMQLQYKQQGTISDHSGLHWMETIYKRKSGTSQSTHELQELSHLYVNKGTKRMTSQMAPIPQPI